MASILALSAAACSNTTGEESKTSTDASAASTASVVSDSSNETGTDSSDQQSAQTDSKTASLEYWTTVAQLINSDPSKLPQLGQLSAVTLKKLHSIKIENNEFPNKKETFIEWIDKRNIY